MNKQATRKVVFLKRNLLPLCFLLSGIILGGFTQKQNNPNQEYSICKYFVFNPFGGCSEVLYSSYTAMDTQPSQMMCPSNGRVCWIRICDQDNDGDVDEVDFDLVVEGSSPGMGLDIDRDGQISDDQNENHTTYEECFNY